MASHQEEIGQSSLRLLLHNIKELDIKTDLSEVKDFSQGMLDGSKWLRLKGHKEELWSSHTHLKLSQ